MNIVLRTIPCWFPSFEKYFIQIVYLVLTKFDRINRHPGNFPTFVKWGLLLFYFNYIRRITDLCTYLISLSPFLTRFWLFAEVTFTCAQLAIKNGWKENRIFTFCCKHLIHGTGDNKQTNKNIIVNSTANCLSYCNHPTFNLQH